MAFQVLLVFHPRFEESPEMLKGIVHHQRTHRPWQVSLHDEIREGVDVGSWVRSRKWDGVISRNPGTNLRESCHALGLPFVDLSDTNPVTGVSRIGPNNRAIGQMGARHLLSRKFRSFAFCGFANHSSSHERRNGFLHLLEQSGHRGAVLEAEYPAEPTPAWETRQISLLASWLQTLPRESAIMACSDLRALQVLAAARKAGLPVPEDLAILGANNDAMRCELSDPSLSSVAVNSFEAGRLAAEHLDRVMLGSPNRLIDLRLAPVGVVPRMSTDVLALRDKNVASAVQYIQDHACENITVDHVLRTVATSRSQLEHKFRQYLGRSPQVEIRRVQVARICQLLAETKLPLKDIAQQTGFVHVEYLCVVFKRITGCTPSEFRRQKIPRPELAEKIA